MKKVMVVDDKADIRNTVKTILEKEGYEVVTAVNGGDCLERIQEENPDLVLLDIMMPGVSVNEVVKKIKNVKVIFLTIVRMSDVEREGLMKEGNVVDYIQKPFDVDDLIQRVKKGLGE